MTKRLTMAIALIATCLYLAMNLCTAAAEHSSDDRAARNRLLGREQDLLRRGDTLSREVYELKLAFNEICKKLNFAQDDLEQTNREIVTVRMLLAE